jgi:hypothetical protein
MHHSNAPFRMLDYPQYNNEGSRNDGKEYWVACRLGARVCDPQQLRQ